MDYTWHNIPEPPLEPPPERELPDIGRCDYCGEPILEGEEYASAIGEGIYHADCLDCLSTAEWMKLAGLVVQTATEEW